MIDVSLHSSSTVIGASDVELTITMTPETALTADGLVILTVPEYYVDSNNDFMFSGREIEGCTNSLGGVTNCTFTSRLMQLEIIYFFSSREDESGPVVFTVPSFNNPIINGMGGFKILVLDQEEYEIGETLMELQIGGITEHAPFASHAFDYIDTPNSGQHAVH
jgi:hypothetical protein